MRALGGGEISRDEVMELSFEAEGELQDALNEAYIALLEFAHDRNARQTDRELDSKARANLKSCLDRIVALCERDPE